MHEEHETRRRFRVVGAPGEADDTQPCQTVPEPGSRGFFRRRHDEQISEARDAGRREVCAANASAAPVALVPEEFLQICRLGGSTAREVPIVGMRVMVVPSRHGTEPSPEAELAAWERLRTVVTRTTLAADGDVDDKTLALPPQVSAAYWRDPSGNQLRITADHCSLGWLRHRLGRPGGVASLVPVVGVGGAKLALGAALTVGVVAVVVTPGGPVPHTAEVHHPHEFVQEFVPSLGAWATPNPAKPRKQLLKKAPGSAQAEPTPKVSPTGVAPTPAPQAAPAAPVVPVVPIDPPVAQETAPAAPAPTELPTPTPPPAEVPSVTPPSILDVLPSERAGE